MNISMTRSLGAPPGPEGEEEGQGWGNSRSLMEKANLIKWWHRIKLKKGAGVRYGLTKAFR